MSMLDFAVREPSGRLAALVEAKARRGTSSMWAQQLRRNLAVHTSFPRDAFFALVTPQVVYVWAPEAEIEDLPTYEVLGSDVLGPYFEKAGLELDDFVDPGVFELIVRAWLGDLAAGTQRLPEALASSGLAQRVHGGTVLSEVAA